MTAPRAHVTVDTRDLRAALIATSVHLSTAEGEVILCRIRLTFSPDGNLYVTATDRYTAGLAIVSIWEDRCEYGEAVDVDLFAEDAKAIVSLFKPAKNIDDQKLSLLVTGSQIVITDASGLFPDQSLSLHLPITTPCKYPSVDLMFAAAVAKARQLEIADTTPLATSQQQLTRFAAAGSAYGAPIEVAHTSEARRALLVKVGESFLGLLMPLNLSGDAQEASASHLAAWSRRLPEPLGVPVEMPEPVDTSAAVDLSDLDETQA